MLSVGDFAPDFELPDQVGRLTSRSDFLGRVLVIYFYPKDGSGACTRQACGLRDVWERLKENEVAVVGISPDDVESHRMFSQENDLPQVLLADPEHRAIDAYGVWGEKVVKGITKHGVVRSTFLVDETGAVIEQWRDVDPDEHADEILKSVGDLKDQRSDT